MMWPRDVPYVTDREAFAIARVLQPEHPDIARRIRRGVWKRRMIAALSGLMVLIGALLIFSTVLIVR